MNFFKTFYINKHPWGFWNSLLFAFLVLGDGVIRVCTFGIVCTTWTGQFSYNQAKKAIDNHKRTRSAKD